jgi:hypothetical protein
MGLTNGDLYETAVLTLLIPHSAQSGCVIEKSRLWRLGGRGARDQIRSCPNLIFKASLDLVPGSVSGPGRSAGSFSDLYSQAVNKTGDALVRSSRFCEIICLDAVAGGRCLSSLP